MSNRLLSFGFVLLGLLCFTAVVNADEADDVTRLAAEIDRLIEEKWKTEGVTPAPIADDAEFFRRLHLDLCGRIPRAAEVRDFLADESPNKRSEAIEDLLRRPTFVIHHTNLWRAAMIPEADADQGIRFQLPGFEAWLRSRIAENKNFAEITEEILTLPVNPENQQQFIQPDRPTPVAFYLAKEFKVERLTAATSRLFLGVRIDCAQCHDHPFDHWKQPEFWSLAAFYDEVPRVGPDAQPGAPGDGRSIQIPETDKTVSARFLDGQEPDWKGGDSSRAKLAKWITSTENPYFAKAAVNRIWSYHFGLGLVEPMDDFSDLNPPSHPELLQLLADEFVSHNYDFKFMTRAITNSKTYQRTSRQTDDSQGDSTLFARSAVRGMTPEQIFDSLAQATGYRQPFDPEQPVNFNNDTARQDFLGTFTNDSDSPIDRATSILQALSLMNGNFVNNATDLTDSRTLAAIIDSPFLDVNERVDALYLSTLSRMPSDAERARCVDYIQSGGSDGDAKAAVADLFWALLNSSEFLLNH
ncbi:MAG: DUF1553 domain-containing protein [Planctomycetaceae bacterium]|nr:DUF1553 domain-containing protein [Planctomycetaceae bacterium]